MTHGAEAGVEAGEELNVAARGLATGYSSGSAMPGSASALLVAHFSRRRRTESRRRR